MIHIRSIAFAPRPSRIDVKPAPAARKTMHADLRKTRKQKRRKPCPITYSHS